MSRLTLRELRSQVNQSLGLRSSNEIVSGAFIDGEINQAIQKLNTEFEIYLAQWYATSVKDKIQYALPKLLVKIGRVHFDDILIDHRGEKPLRDIKDNEDVQDIAWTEEV